MAIDDVLVIEADGISSLPELDLDILLFRNLQDYEISSLVLEFHFTKKSSQLHAQDGQYAHQSQIINGPWLDRFNSKSVLKVNL